MKLYTLYILEAFFFSMLIGFITIPIIIKFCKKYRLFDQPNTRKIHNTAIPRLGGISFIPSMMLAMCAVITIMNASANDTGVQLNLWSVIFFFSLFIIYMLGFIDDIFGLEAKYKFIVQIVAASMLPLLGRLYINNLYGFMGIYEIPFAVSVPLTIFVIVFVCNAINLIDGIDGLSAGLSIIALCGFLACFIFEGLILYSMLIASLIGVLVAFIRYNMFGKVEKNNKIFMGDSGSLTLGFILGFLLVKISMDNPNILPFRKNSILIAYTMVIVPTFDVCRVILVRLWHGCPIFDADKNHLHHKLMRTGLTQHYTLAVILSIALFYIILNIVLNRFFTTTHIVMVDIVIWFALQIIINLIIRWQGKSPFIRQLQKKDKFR